MKRQKQLFHEINQQPGIHIHLEEANTVRTIIIYMLSYSNM